jgi:inosine-uridine nucleoside N-ribohydrolase
LGRGHLDTDLGSDADDLCALAMLLGWPATAVTGVTTTTDPGGRRAGMAAVVVPLAATSRVHLRAAHLARLRAAGPLGALLADQGEAHARDQGTTALGRAWPGLPDDLLNFHHDPLACAVALGLGGATVEEVPTGLEVGGGRLVMTRQAGARPLRVVTAVDGPAFEAAWLAAVERAAAVSRP